MLALASQSVIDRPQLRNGLLVDGIFGTSIFYADAVITPGIPLPPTVDGMEAV